MSVRDWLIGLYPGWWRERYGEEFGALLDLFQISASDALDVVLGALDARLHGFEETHLPRKGQNMRNVQHKKELGLAAAMVITAAVIDLSVMALVAFAWFQETAALAVLAASAGVAATAGFVAVAARNLHAARQREA